MRLLLVALAHSLFLSGKKEDPAGIGNTYFWDKINHVLDGKNAVNETEKEPLYQIPKLIKYWATRNEEKEDSVESEPPTVSSRIRSWWHFWSSKPEEDIEATPAADLEPLLVPSIIPGIISEPVITETQQSEIAKDPETILPDPRLVPHSVFEMKCQPGIAFHQCIQICLGERSQDKDMQTAHSFQSCVEDCRDAFLKAPAPGCMDINGQVFQPSQAAFMPGAASVITQRKVRWKAFWYRMGQFSLRRPLQRHLGLLAIAFMALVIWLVIYLNAHVAAYTLVHGPVMGLTDSSSSKARWTLVNAAESWRKPLMVVTEYVEQLGFRLLSDSNS